MGRLSLTVLITLVVSLGAQAVTGSGDSAISPLETISPSLQSVTATGQKNLSATFSEPMLTPGVTAPGNYAVSGLGGGTLVPGPTGASGGPLTVTLDWMSGEMRDGVALTLTTLGVRDVVGNPINPGANSASCNGLGIAPIISDLTVTPSKASAGQIVSVSFMVSEDLDGTPEVTVNGNAATPAVGKASGYIFEYEVREEDPPGMATITLSGADLAGNIGTLSNNDLLEIVEGEADLPLWGWPWVAAVIPALGLIFITRRRFPVEAASSRFGNAARMPRLHFSLLLASTLACASAVAQTPSVSNITFTQSPSTASTQVDIYYDLIAPNGPCDILVSLSKDGGADGHIHPITSVTGDLANVSTGSGKHIVWDIRADYPEEDIPNARIRIEADDGVVQYTLTYTAGPNGSISGASPQTVNHGASGTEVTAVPDTGYHFVQWSDGVLTAARTDTNVVADSTVTATFAINTYTLTYTAGEIGSISGASPQTVNYGASGTEVTAVPDDGYAFNQWSDGLLTATRQDTNIMADLSVEASFVQLPPEVSSFAVNGGAQTTMLLQVTLDNTCTSSPTEYMASESAAFTEATWQLYGTAPSFMLSFGVGMRTVYFKVRNGAGESGVASDTIFITPNTVSAGAGAFQMGRTSAGDDETYGGFQELPVHSVTLGAYQIGKAEVTNKEYCDVLNWAAAQGFLLTNAGAVWTGTGDIYAGGTAASRYPIVSLLAADCDIQYSGGVFSAKMRVGLPGSTNYSMDAHPMVRVSWYGSVAFCNWLSQWEGLTPCYDMNTMFWPLTVMPPTSGGYRLPTEAEWERAAAWDGSTHWIYSFINDTLTGKNRANYWDSSPNYVNPLGLTSQPYTSPAMWFDGVNVSPNGDVVTVDSASPVGAYDMSGNIAEWCHDWFGSTYYSGGSMANPTGPPGGSDRVIRGGSWGSNFSYCRSAGRIMLTPTNTFNYYGFRLARTAVTQYALTYMSDGNGTISGPSPQVVVSGGSGTAVTAVPNGGYTFSQWSDGVLTATRQDTNVTADFSVTAEFVSLLPVVTSFVINSGAETTMQLAVALNNTCTGSPTEYMASESAAFTGSTWQAYGTHPSFTLSVGLGPRTVYFKTRNEVGESGSVSGTIFVTPNRVSVISGTFSMGRTGIGDDEIYGEPDELPVHSVTLGTYQIGKSEVTNKEYCDVLNWARAQGFLFTSTGAAWTGTGDIYAGGTAASRYLIVSITSAYCDIQYAGGVFTSKARVGLPGTTSYSMDTHPMVMVSWYGSVAFCNWLSQWQGLTPCYNMNLANWPLVVAPPTWGGYRLPTEAEWERAGAWNGAKHWIYGFMSDINTSMTANRCNDRNSGADDNPLGLTTQPYTSPAMWFNGINVNPNGSVATVNSPGPAGAYDMSGNVAEWCHDWYSPTYYSGGSMTNPTGPGGSSYRVVRGGGWYYYFCYCRSSDRSNGTPTNTNYFTGFRLARS